MVKRGNKGAFTSTLERYFDKTDCVSCGKRSPKALFSIKWFAKSNKLISAYTKEAQEEFYKINIEFPKKSFIFMARLNSMINKYKTGKRNYPLLIGCGSFDIPMELEAVKQWKISEPNCRVAIFENAGHCVNMDVPQEFNETVEDFWTSAE